MNEQANSNPHPAQDTAVPAAHEPIRWQARWRVEKYRGDWDAAALADGQAGDPYETLEVEGNLLLYGGASALWDRLIGANNVTAFDNTNAYLGVGDSASAAAATQTDLQGTNTNRQSMAAGYPAHTDGTGSGAESLQFQAVFGTADANFAWQEWGLFNAASAGRMLNRKVASLGTKTSADSWRLTVTLSLS